MVAIVWKVVVALLAGLFAFVLLAPASGTDSIPPTCYQLWGWFVVPCDASAAWAAAAATTALVGWALWLRERRGVASG
jgi:hypothetical protein